MQEGGGRYEDGAVNIPGGGLCDVKSVNEQKTDEGIKGVNVAQSVAYSNAELLRFLNQCAESEDEIDECIP